ncbi:LysR family transcriptional regulator [Neptuniibacter caesariensis]|uniref:Hypothetical transcriptional regulator n=1 Tax=Neptuniibacter caesariensis TaxID=207954 RepID=A0A7U8C6W4_NEPCE|nr:LysR family transcriptional regulator [Neptuniibacter caesariensis]EAR62688.1 hypothetical transcriptional regulator [Oceanospirillum sp. MED92] [Neptuniibacter caesariensis]
MPSYNLEHLKMFTECVKAGSFSAAARKLGKVQSAVSQGIANLEIDLGAELFDRSSRKPVLTPEGTRLLYYAQAVLQQVNELEIAARKIEQGDELQVRLALEDGLLSPRLSDILNCFAKLFPATRLEIISASTSAIIQMIKRDKADLGMTFCDQELDAEINQCFIGNLPFYAVCSPEHPLREATEITLHNLFPHRQIVLHGQERTRLDLVPEFSTHIIYADSFLAIREMVRSGIGWSYLPKHLVEEEIQAGRLYKLTPSFDSKPWSPPVETVLAKDRSIGPALNWLANALKGLL